MNLSSCFENKRTVLTEEKDKSECNICLSPPRSGERRANERDLRPIEGKDRHALMTQAMR